jgi:hypothetical protein
MKRFSLAVAAVFLALPVFASSVPDLSSPYRSGRLDAKRAAVGEERLELDVKALAALRAAGSVPFTLSNFPIAPGARARLILRRFEIASPDARIRVTGPGGDTFLPLPEIAHFAGSVAGEPDSTVYLGARPGFLVASVRSSAGSSYVGPDEARSGFIIRDSASPANTRYAEKPWRCDQESLAELPAQPSLRPKATEAPDIVGFQKGGLIVETDQELLAKFSGDIDAMTAYLLSVFAQFNLIYERDLSFHLTVTEVHAWTVADPWDGPDPLSQLFQLGNWYHTHRPLGSYPRATVNLTSGLPVAGGVAWRPALCIADIMVGPNWAGAYGVSQLYADYPAQKWDLIVTTHEVGHNAGSVHTHCYAPPIDMCYSGEVSNPPSPPCYSGPTSLPPGGGTIMSYCHLLAGGEDNINMQFHQRCLTEQMLPYIQAATCTTAVPTFPDVPVTNPFFHYVETIYQLGITGGCQGGNYCPGNPVTRAQMAVFLLKAKEGAAYTPPACVGVFPDVPCSNQFAPWIEELYHRNITGGCGNGNYCPDSTVTRKQMAPFLLKSLYGSSHVPPPCAGTFADVPCTPGVGFDDFIEELYSLKITGGCQTSPLLYCPDNANTRAQMAVFLVKTFNLVW